MSWWSLKSWQRQKPKCRTLTLSEADKILRDDVHFMASHQFCGKFQAIFYNSDVKYIFEIDNLTPFDIEMLYKTYPLLYNYVESLAF